MPNPQPDLALREQVALRLGWERISLPKPWHWSSPDGDYALDNEDLPAFERFLAAAEVVLDWLKANGYQWALYSLTDHYKFSVWPKFAAVAEWYVDAPT